MGTRDPRVDAYIAASADFARPILEHIREVVHSACADVQESIKWSFPHFEHRGILCSMASFKGHCALGFWKGALVLGPEGGTEERAMGQFGRITSLADLPPDDVLAGYVRKAVELNQQGTKVAGRGEPRPRRELEVPGYFTAALAASPQARATFEGFSPSQRREYVEWVTGAKTDETRSRRLATAVEWLAAGKTRNWKYERR